MRARPELKARWRSGQLVQPGIDAQAYLRDAAERLGEDPTTILDILRPDTPANRLALAALGLTHAALYFTHRPPDSVRAELIVTVVDDLMRCKRLSFAEACEMAPKYLSDPAKRAREKIGRGTEELLANGSTPRNMTAGSVRNAYRKAYGPLLVAKYFQDIKED